MGLRHENRQGKAAVPESGAAFQTEFNIEFICRVVLFLSLAVILISRLRLLGIPLERDEGEYAYFGQLILQGVPPYKLAYNMKLPGTYAIYALIMAIFGQSTTGIHMGLLAANLVSIALVFFIGKKLFGAIAGTFSAISYAFLSFSPSVLGAHAHATQFLVLMVLCGLAVLLKAIETEKKFALFVSGVFFGLAFLMKQHGIFFAIFAVFYILWAGFTERPSLRARLTSMVAVFSAGALTPFAVTCFVLLTTGSFEKFWFWTFDYASKYSAVKTPGSIVSGFLQTLRDVAKTFLPIWFFAAFGYAALFLDTKSARRAALITALLAASILAVCLGFIFREHYYVVLLPAVSLLAGFFISRTCDLTRGPLKIVPVAVFLFLIAIPVFHERGYLFFMPPEKVSKWIYGGNPFNESVKIADYIRSNSDPGDTIAVLGSEPQIYFYSKRHSATGYIYVYPLMEPQPYALDMQAEMIREIEIKKPKYLVYAGVPTSWARRKESPDLILKWADSYVYRWYDITGVINIWDTGTEYHWDDAARNIKARSPAHLLVYRRRQEERR